MAVYTSLQIGRINFLVDKLSLGGDHVRTGVIVESGRPVRDTISFEFQTRLEVQAEQIRLLLTPGKACNTLEKKSGISEGRCSDCPAIEWNTKYSCTSG